MLLLIKKDLVIHKLSWLLYFAMLLFFIVLNKDVMFVVAIITAIITMNTFHYDELAHGNKLWNSLPFTRKEIVSARYSTLLVVLLMVTAIVMTVARITNGEWSSAFSSLSIWEEIIGSFIVMMVSASIFFPVVYKFAQKKTIFTFVILFIGTAIAGVYSIYYLYKYLIESTSIIQSMGIGLYWALLAIGSLVCYVLSWGLSLKIYKAKEFL
ncbi:ABC-2 transporter permease [Sporosarcina sp. Te-1]|uniref:ABC-2 transporter permease n=1 Tax=Sporosarcina sp. Te-1 TaxID=2818390 RepID=UPI001AA0065E|nr:ABC-2 transporter permease [Sporosarcina sp. Te-1]QTD43194.1 ABC-2 transporter permease [Sporosarcina sp. Te-1]